MGHYSPLPYRYATSLPEREGKDYRRVIVVPPLPLGEGYQLAGKGGGA